MVSRDWRHEATSPDRKFRNLLTRDCGADRGRGRNQAARPEPQREAEVLDIARAARSRAKQGQEKLKRAYGQLLNSTGSVAGQLERAARFAHDEAPDATKL
jgi:hypothetical protein